MHTLDFWKMLFTDTESDERHFSPYFVSVQVINRKLDDIFIY